MKKSKTKVKNVIKTVVLGFILFASIIIIALVVDNISRKSNIPQEPIQNLVETSTPAPTPTPTPTQTPDPNQIHKVDLVDMWLNKINDFVDKRIQFSAFVRDNEIEVKTDGEILGYIILRQPINYIDDELDKEIDYFNGNAEEQESEEELELTVISELYVTIVGRVSITPNLTEDDDDIIIIFLDEVIAEVATEEEIEQIYIREDERIAVRVAREKRIESARVAREEREEAERLAPQTMALGVGVLTLKINGTYSFKPIITPEENNAQITYSVRPSALATVDENGVLTALNRGSGVVTATTQNGVTASCDLRVEEQSPVTLRNMKYSIDFAGGVEWTLQFRNNSDKEINYVIIRWDCYNAVGDKIKCLISGSSEVGLRFTGPLKGGETSTTKRNTAKFYNSTYSSSKFTQIIVEFADGTITTLDDLYYDIFS
ncbi:MAG: Ig-like domain-containing protein [Oscillospiraceae bacterium]|jgi:hypothetical protein|nr:Ig-like domain-containing protein [Oscillospiraceae bacterium]